MDHSHNSLGNSCGMGNLIGISRATSKYFDRDFSIKKKKIDREIPIKNFEIDREIPINFGIFLDLVVSLHVLVLTW
jgi:hypothetical protein